MPKRIQDLDLSFELEQPVVGTSRFVKPQTSGTKIIAKPMRTDEILKLFDFDPSPVVTRARKQLWSVSKSGSKKQNEKCKKTAIKENVRKTIFPKKSSRRTTTVKTSSAYQNSPLIDMEDLEKHPLFALNSVKMYSSDKYFVGYIKYKEPDYGYAVENYIANDDDENLLFDRDYAGSLWISDIHTLFLFARKGLMQLEVASISETSHEATNYSEIRKRICELWLASRHFVTSFHDQSTVKCQLVRLMKKVFICVKRFEQLPDYVLFNSAKRTNNLDHHASYNFLHLSLDIFWLSLTVEHHTECDPVAKLEIFETNLNLLLTDLIHVGIRAFERMSNYNNLSKHSPFVCTCFKELWLLIQLYVEQQQFCKEFWHYFNIAAENVLKLQTCTNGKVAVQCIWLLYHVAHVQGYDRSGTFVGPEHDRVVSNYILVEQCLKIITNSALNNIDESLLCSCLHVLGPLFITWWIRDAKFDMLQILWEFFYKRLNIPVHTGNDSGSFINHSQVPCDFITLTETILNYDFATPSTTSSYDIFLCMLGNHLRANPILWPKLKGRIYSKLSAPKLAVFSDTGLQNLIQLFFVLAHILHFDELMDKLQSLLSQLPAARTERSLIIWCAHMSVISMRAHRGMSLSEAVGGAEICAPVYLAVQTVSSDRTSAHLMRVYIDGVKNLVDNDMALQFQGHVLFGNWISRYLRWCSHSDACHLLDILITVVEKVRTLGAQQEWWTMLESYVVPSLNQLTTNVDAPQQVTELAAALVTADVGRFKTLLEHMTGDTVHVQLSIKFLKSLLEDNLNTLEQFLDNQTVLIQTWIRIALLSTDKSDLAEVTQLMSQLPQWPDIIGCFDVLATEDPLYAVIRLAGGRVRNAQSMTETFAVKRWFETYFGKMDKWAAPVLLAAEKGDNAQLVLRLYTSAALLFLHCAPALYIKNKSTCLFYRVTSSLLLPAAVLMNKKPPSVILAALSKTWHLFVRGIVRLDYKTDTYIERTFKDMVIRYVPHLNESTSPLIRCLDTEFDDAVTSFVLNKISTTFITCKSKNSHEFSRQALKLTLEMFRYRCDNISKIELLMKILFPSVLEQIMFNEDLANKQLAFQTIECVKSNPKYSEIRELIVNAVSVLMEKHMAFYSSSVFRLVEILIPVLYVEMESSVPYLKDAISKVECRRGVGYDNTLRKGLQRIQEILNQQSK
ncbi:uncharacterized protein CBL_03707 [Carabus blaptoides fortunei]